MNPYFKFVENLTDPEAFSNFTDSLIKYIEVTPKHEFHEARELLKRLHLRDLYKCVAERILTNEQSQQVLSLTA